MALTHPDRDLRQRDLVPPEKLRACPVLVIGVGAVGRQVALQLAAMGTMDLTLVDFDSVEEVNLGPQGYLPQDLGKPKVEATAELCRLLNPDLAVQPANERFRRSSTRTLGRFAPGSRPPAVFCCVDSITARGLVWEAVREQAGFFADARMSGETLRVLACEHPGRDWCYATTLFAQEQAHAGACTARSTIYTAAIAAGLMLSQFTRWLRGMAVDRDVVLNLLASELTVG